MMMMPMIMMMLLADGKIENQARHAVATPCRLAALLASAGRPVPSRPIPMVWCTRDLHINSGHPFSRMLESAVRGKWEWAKVPLCTNLPTFVMPDRECRIGSQHH